MDISDSAQNIRDNAAGKMEEMKTESNERIEEMRRKEEDNKDDSPDQI